MKIKSKTVIIIAVVLIVITSTVFLLSQLPRYIQNTTVSVLEDKLGRKVTFENVKFNYLTGTVRLNGLKIMEKDEKQVFVAFDSLDINVDPSRFISRTLYIKEISLMKPSVRVDFSEGKKNFDDIIERMKAKTQEKSNAPQKQDKFLKKVKVRDVTIDKFIVYHKDDIISSENAFTFKSPEILYENNVLKVSSNLNLEDMGSTRLELLIDNTTGNLKGNLKEIQLELSGIGYAKKLFPKFGKLEGNFSGTTSFSGNTKKKEYFFSGSFSLSDLLAENISGDNAFSLKSTSVSSASMSYPGLDIKLGKVAVDAMFADIEKLKELVDSRVKDEKSGSSENEKKFSFSVEDLKVDKSSVSYKNYRLKNMSLQIKSIASKLDSSFPLSVSFDLNENIAVSTNSQVNLLQDIAPGVDFKKSMSATGDFSTNVKDLGIINTLKADLPYKMSSDGFSSKGSYSFKYPDLKLSADTKLNSLSMKGQKNMLNDVSLGNTNAVSQIAFNMEDKSYTVSGPAAFEKLLVYDKNGRQIFGGKLSMELEDIRKDRFFFKKVSVSDIFIDLSKELQLSKDDEKKVEQPHVKISQMDLNGGKIIFKDMSLEDIKMAAKDFSNETTACSLDGSAMINGNIQIAGDGVLRIKNKISGKADLENLNFEGKINVPNVNLSNVNKFLKEKPYNLKGMATLESRIAYNSKTVATANKMSLKEVRVSNSENSDEYYFKGGNADFKMDIKAKKPEIYNGKFSIDSFKVNSIDKFNASGDKLDLNVDRASKSKISINTLNVSNPHMSVYKKNSKKTEEIEERPEISMKKLSLNNGELNILGKRNYDIKKLEAVVNDFSTLKGKKFNTNFSGLLLGSGNFSGNASCSLSKNWDFSPKSMNINGNVNIQNLDLMNFDDIITANFPSKLNSGKLFYDGTYDINKGKLSGENSIVVKEISLGQSTGNFLTLPLDKAITAMKDKSGNINFNIPVAGDFNDPNFSFSKVLSQGIRNVLIKSATTSSIEAITKAITKGISEDNKEIETVYFQYLSDEFSQTEIKKLDAIADKLKAHPELQANFVLFTDSKKEKDLLKLRLIGLAILKGNVNELLNSDFQNLVNSRGETILNFFKNRGLDKQITIKSSDESKTLPQASVSFTTVSDNLDNN